MLVLKRVPIVMVWVQAIDTKACRIEPFYRKICVIYKLIDGVKPILVVDCLFKWLDVDGLCEFTANTGRVEFSSLVM